MKKFITLLTLAAASVVCISPLSAQAEKKKKEGAPKQQPLVPGARLSPHETVYNRLASSAGRTLVSITYGRPYSAKGGKGESRKIWGGLVKWDAADRLGSDEATTFLAERDLDFGGTTIPAGIHALYIIPSENGTSQLAFSKNANKWGVPVDTKSDIARVDLKKETISETFNQLTITIETPAPDQGVIKIKWENTQFSVPFKVKG